MVYRVPRKGERQILRWKNERFAGYVKLQLRACYEKFSLYSSICRHVHGSLGPFDWMKFVIAMLRGL